MSAQLALKMLCAKIYPTPNRTLCSGMFICHVSRHEYANMSRTMECLCACHDGLFGGIVVEECFLQTSNAIVK